jgi:ferredoxin
MCVGCGQCTTKCKFDAISLVRKYDKTSVEIKDLKPTVAKNMIRRQGRIAVKRVKHFFVK